MRVVLMSMMMTVATAGFCQTPKVASDAPANQVWEIPFASEGNTISLDVQNNSNLEAKDVSVKFTNLPAWLEFRTAAAMIKTIILPAD